MQKKKKKCFINCVVVFFCNCPYFLESGHHAVQNNEEIACMSNQTLTKVG